MSIHSSAVQPTFLSIDLGYYCIDSPYASKSKRHFKINVKKLIETSRLMKLDQSIEISALLFISCLWLRKSHIPKLPQCSQFSLRNNYNAFSINIVFNIVKPNNCEHTRYPAHKNRIMFSRTLIENPVESCWDGSVEWRRLLSKPSDLNTSLEPTSR